jgi:hypothetical protein
VYYDPRSLEPDGPVGVLQSTSSRSSRHEQAGELKPRPDYRLIVAEMALAGR